MYQALYRKYRPSTFDDVAGQKVVTTTIKNALINNKISHAYIFSGPRGTGKTSIAKLLAKAVNCTDENKLICNECVNCTQIINKQSSDIIEIDAASNNGVDEIREIRNNVTLVPTVGKYKIYIIDEVHMLTPGAFNALLKTLEEPPKHAIFILATTEPHKIPATISSRCQKFEFKKISFVDMKNKLNEIVKKENISISTEALEEIVRISDGGLRDCISLLDQVSSYANEGITIDDVHEINGTLNKGNIISFINCILNKDIINVFKNIDEFYQSGKDIIKVTEEMLLNLRNILISKIDISLIGEVNDYKQYGDVDKNDIIQLINLLNLDFNKFKMSNDPKLCLEINLIKFINNLKNEYNLNIKLNSNKTEKDFVINNEEKVVSEFLENNGVENNDSVLEITKHENNINEETTDNDETLKDVAPENSELNNGQAIDNNEIESIDTDEANNIQENIDATDNAINISSMMKNFVDTRIDNTLSKFNKPFLMNAKARLGLFDNYKNDPEYSYVVDMISDSDLKAASDEYLVFVCITQLQSETFNKNIDKIEKLILKVFNRKFKVISTNLDSWNVIKVDFNEKRRVFEYIEENIDFIKAITNENEKEKSELDEIYGSLVQYEEEK